MRQQINNALTPIFDKVCCNIADVKPRGPLAQPTILRVISINLDISTVFPIFPKQHIFTGLFVNYLEVVATVCGNII
jgi:hypothetical protein